VEVREPGRDLPHEVRCAALAERHAVALLDPLAKRAAAHQVHHLRRIG
jgi:hypothetical protein